MLCSSLHTRRTTKLWDDLHYGCKSFAARKVLRFFWRLISMGFSSTHRL